MVGEDIFIRREEVGGGGHDDLAGSGLMLAPQDKVYDEGKVCCFDVSKYSAFCGVRTAGQIGV